jgi:hypothetical protein
MSDCIGERTGSQTRHVTFTMKGGMSQGPVIMQGACLQTPAATVSMPEGPPVCAREA